jgi:hypothetical protein
MDLFADVFLIITPAVQVNGCNRPRENMKREEFGYKVWLPRLIRGDLSSFFRKRLSPQVGGG